MNFCFIKGFPTNNICFGFLNPLRGFLIFIIKGGNGIFLYNYRVLYKFVPILFNLTVSFLDDVDLVVNPHTPFCYLYNNNKICGRVIARTATYIASDNLIAF